MKIKITPSKLSGDINAPSSKSYSHRMIIAASLCNGTSIISNINPSEDIDATCECMTALGAVISSVGSTYTVTGIETPSSSAVLNCRESGSTLRFLIPVAAVLGCSSEFYGSAKLPTRPITPYKQEMSLKGITFTHTEGVMPFSIEGKLSGGVYSLAGDISSQFITGLLFALPLCNENSSIKLTSKLESKPYADMTVAALKLFGIFIDETIGEDGLLVYNIKGNQKYMPCNCTVEGDFSQAAFFYTANSLGANICLHNLYEKSVQGDKKILEILKEIGYNEKCIGVLKPFNVDVSNIPDLVPTLTVLGCFTSGVSRIYNAARLKIKESDRLTAIADALNNIGGNVVAGDDFLEIHPISHFTGGNVEGCNDHRIVMASAIASVKSLGDIIISDAEAVSKSYPDFWKDFASIGGICTIIDN